ncbi:F-actin-monooxygenase mical2 [Eurytemora carolleeae]|uniref:F-actin-monooxygenase mical2 n=1 Tax=Eurytemora carolleeae TaxID=1294199 RepID=UPI000C7889CD|nr:F-actin-monooxygenase mical2 [Eurytemora carolleeae]|eukprot:XP_023346418.1 F-actin-monooxygenase mical2-like [Eurytemora affinis]
MVVRGTTALEVWSKRVTAGYPGVRIVNMTTSFKDGLAFCAIIHHFHPELIDFHSLVSDNIEENCRLAFNIAESKLGIPALLDPIDMATCASPDRRSILLYLSEFYSKLATNNPPSPAQNLSKINLNSSSNLSSSPTRSFSLSANQSPSLPSSYSSSSTTAIDQSSLYTSPVSLSTAVNHPTKLNLSSEPNNSGFTDFLKPLECPKPCNLKSRLANLELRDETRPHSVLLSKSAERKNSVDSGFETNLSCSIDSSSSSSHASPRVSPSFSSSTPLRPESQFRRYDVELPEISNFPECNLNSEYRGKEEFPSCQNQITAKSLITSSLSSSSFSLLSNSDFHVRPASRHGPSLKYRRSEGQPLKKLFGSEDRLHSLRDFALNSVNSEPEKSSKPNHAVERISGDTAEESVPSNSFKSALNKFKLSESLSSPPEPSKERRRQLECKTTQTDLSLLVSKVSQQDKTLNFEKQGENLKPVVGTKQPLCSTSSRIQLNPVIKPSDLRRSSFSSKPKLESLNLLRVDRRPIRNESRPMVEPISLRYDFSTKEPKLRQRNNESVGHTQSRHSYHSSSNQDYKSFFTNFEGQSTLV